ncbi:MULTISPECIES: amino acid ABC transporter permease [unclassified Burkholderia]|uniref:amino acid ABC transporter permease n=1 Tax=unclassified Burkholderia TaxID=2613784 RepID=UPI0014236579|nr:MULTISPECIES: amino acid ABC transporter permease [unclassified Burkholderia]NIE83379.1 amino acid ABC transporter permease [Burkholderia sp. Tr-860]NIF61715.1 amino acid ABC transporter permease [Burkholderia sp. Cy-647]NIF96888.1 amino acid ABC transporter permease [Burkholderia sp. Ax-1720]
MNYQWSWSAFHDISGDGISSYADQLLRGAGWTVATALVAALIALSVGVTVGLLRTSTNRLGQYAGASYVELFRDIPLLVQVFLWYFVVPELLPHALGAWIKGLEYGSFVTASIAIGLYTAARVAEQTRAAIAALPGGQGMAGLALGLTGGGAFRLIILPQAARLMIPPLTSELVNLVKNTSIGMTIGLMELTARAREMQETTFHTFEAFSAATAGYLLINLLLIGAMRCIAAGQRHRKAQAARVTSIREALP